MTTAISVQNNCDMTIKISRGPRGLKISLSHDSRHIMMTSSLGKSLLPCSKDILMKMISWIDIERRTRILGEKRSWWKCWDFEVYEIWRIDGMFNLRCYRQDNAEVHTIVICTSRQYPRSRQAHLTMVTMQIKPE